MTLEDWQSLLFGHFQKLAERRKASGLPIFALEHGLSDGDLSLLIEACKQRLASRNRPFTNWLPWTIYATERGYSYTGDEYWPSFEDQNPNWDALDRRRVTTWFRKFHTEFNGVVPTGAWAAQFRIIALPITHAILPKLLQRQFAQTLWELRYQLASVGSMDPGVLGNLVASKAYYASTRLQQFLQQEHLTGRIVRALLDEHKGTDEGPIYQPTLDRIVRDLERVRNAREWLRETRQVVVDRFKGFGRPGTPWAEATIPPGQPPPPDSVGSLDIEPTLSLRHIGDQTWCAVLEIPSFRGFASISSDAGQFILRHRCRVNGSNDYRAAGWLLSGAKKVVLKHWPNPDQPAVIFDHPPKALSHLLISECRVGKGPIWLFRLTPDGSALEIASKVVRPDGDYIVVASISSDLTHRWCEPCALSCQGVKAARLRIPEAVSDVDEKGLTALGLTFVRTVRIWPAGIAARGWDGEGRSEWLTTEIPMFGIVHDHSVESISIRLDEHGETVVHAQPPGQPFFIRLPPLSPGKYVLTAKVSTLRENANSSWVRETERVVALSVRDPSSSTTEHVGFVVTVDPCEPTLDEFLEGKVNITASGPIGRRVVSRLSMFNSAGESIVGDQEIHSFELPIKPEIWQRKLHDFCTEDARNGSSIAAASGRLDLIADELGRFSLMLERQLKPVRWVAKLDHSILIVRLVDDTGSESSSDLRFYDFAAPLDANHLAIERAQEGFAIQGTGGLLHADNDGVIDDVIASHSQASAALRDLSVEPSVDKLMQLNLDALALLKMVSMWMNARLIGPLARIRRDRTVKRLCQVLYTTIGGARWGKAEAAFLDESQSASAREALIEAVDRYAGFASLLARDWKQTLAKHQERKQWFCSTAGQFGISQERELCEFALTVAHQPQLLISKYGDRVRELLHACSGTPALIRGARLIALFEVALRAGGPGSSLPRSAWRS